MTKVRYVLKTWTTKHNTRTIRSSTASTRTRHLVASSSTPSRHSWTRQTHSRHILPGTFATIISLPTFWTRSTWRNWHRPTLTSFRLTWTSRKTLHHSKVQTSSATMWKYTSPVAFVYWTFSNQTPNDKNTTDTHNRSTGNSPITNPLSFGSSFYHTPTEKCSCLSWWFHHFTCLTLLFRETKLRPITKASNQKLFFQQSQLEMNSKLQKSKNSVPITKFTCCQTSWEQTSTVVITVQTKSLKPIKNASNPDVINPNKSTAKIKL